MCCCRDQHPGEKAAKTCKNICDVYDDDDAAGEATVRRLFAKFKVVEFGLEYDNCCGRPSKLDVLVF
ncbi:Hypothetical predicted protein [Octopus vulgaris]|uniref:Mos1 transposase HTH domain-containing protein n=1 Tax=Octopus vulgaris TaxID=6645 RepID=A0AA36EVE1_OCTVU|nr:Hypothetical predicted protein [Octopus vulgaris]